MPHLKQAGYKTYILGTITSLYDPPSLWLKQKASTYVKKKHFQKKAILDILPNFKDKNQQTNALILRSLKHLPSSERFKVEKKPARIVFFDFEFKSLKRVPKSRWFSKVRTVRTIRNPISTDWKNPTLFSNSM